MEDCQKVPPILKVSQQNEEYKGPPLNRKNCMRMNLIESEIYCSNMENNAEDIEKLFSPLN
jgi:hypothetical protein